MFKPVLLANSAALIIGHNHPSGDTWPSAEDNAITKRVRLGALVFGLTLHDHLIVSTENKNFYSYANNSILTTYKRELQKQLSVI